MGDMDKLVKLGASTYSGAFGENKDPHLGKGAMAGILDSAYNLLGKGNQVKRIDSDYVEPGGMIGLGLYVIGDDWSNDVDDWIVIVDGLLATVNSVTIGTGECALNLTLPVIHTGTVVIDVKAKKLACSEFEVVGSISPISIGKP